MKLNVIFTICTQTSLVHEHTWSVSRFPNCSLRCTENNEADPSEGIASFTYYHKKDISNYFNKTYL